MRVYCLYWSVAFYHYVVCISRCKHDIIVHFREIYVLNLISQTIRECVFIEVVWFWWFCVCILLLSGSSIPQCRILITSLVFLPALIVRYLLHTLPYIYDFLRVTLLCWNSVPGRTRSTPTSDLTSRYFLRPWMQHPGPMLHGLSPKLESVTSVRSSYCS